MNHFRLRSRVGAMLVALLVAALLGGPRAQAVPPGGSVGFITVDTAGEQVGGIDILITQVAGQWPEPPMAVTTDFLGLTWVGLLPGTYAFAILDDEGAPVPDGTSLIGVGSGGKTYAVLTVPAPVGDIDGDGVVSFSDLLALLSAWGTCPAGGECPEDLNADGVVDFGDLLTLLAHWGP